MVDVGKLKPNPANPNTHPDVQIERLALLIKEHGWRHPITVSKRSGKIVSGHCRLLAAKKLGLKQVPVDYQDFKSDAEEYAVLIADNVVQDLAEIDGLKMADILCELD
jgi:ParB-like chromosome segregation protein Spo0J